MEPLPGRMTEFGWVVSTVGAGLAGPSRFLVVTGEAGVGKTRLVTAAVAGPTTVIVRFPPSVPAAPGHGLVTLAAQLAPDSADLSAHLDAAGGLAHPTREPAILSAADDLLRHSRGWVFVLDDLQWADELTLRWLSHARAALTNSAVAVIATVRSVAGIPTHLSDSLSDLLRYEHFQHRHLGPLDVAGVAALADSLGHPLTDSAAQALHQATDGLPVAVQELLRTSGTWTGSATTGLAIQLPSFTSLVRELAGSLGASARELLHTAAAAPQPVLRSVLRALTPPDQDHRELLSEIFATGLIDLDVDSVTFRHDLHRRVLLDGLDPLAREDCHRRVATALTASADPPAHAIAAQLVAAGDQEQALVWFDRASDDAVRAHDSGTALAQMHAALAVANSAQAAGLAERATLIARWASRPDMGIAVTNAALSTDLAPVDRGRALHARSRLYAAAGDWVERTADLRSAAGEFRNTDALARLALVLGDLAYPIGPGIRLAGLVSTAEEALAAGRQAGDAVSEFVSLGALARLLLELGDARAAEVWQAGAVLARSASVPPAQADTVPRYFFNWSRALMIIGQHAAATGVIEEGRTRAPGEYWKRAFDATEMLRDWRLGDWDKAAAALPDVVDKREQPGVELGEVVETLLSHERDPVLETATLSRAAQSLLADFDLAGPFAVHALAQSRATRREPGATRGIASLYTETLASGRRVGLEDLLVTTSELDPVLGRRCLDQLGSRTLAGPRIEAALSHAQGLTADTSVDAVALLLAAADGYDALGEPLPLARALQAAAARSRTGGPHVAELRRRAAGIYRDLGADRSLAGLLRQARGSRALVDFAMPRTQVFARTPGLTPRQAEVADLARRGFSAREIAEELRISPHTARRHLEAVKDVLGVSRKADLIRTLSGDPG